MAKIGSDVVMEVMTRHAAQNINGERYVHEDDAVVLSKSGLEMGKDLGNIEAEKSLLYVGIGWAVYGAGLIVYNVYEDKIKEGCSKLKEKWDNFRK